MKIIKKILYFPILILKKLKNFIKNIFKKIKVKKDYYNRDLETIARDFYINYGSEIMFKLELGTNGENLTIYTSNFKTTLEKAKKRQKDENEKNENDNTR